MDWRHMADGILRSADILGWGVDISDDDDKVKLSTTKEIDMKNADMPAMPSGKLCDVDENGWAKEFDSNGLTKREMMAMHALNGLMVAYNVENVALDGDSIVRDAVWYADALLAELEKQQ